jgi:hypothetical protein
MIDAIQDLFVYPFKSLGGIRVKQLEILSDHSVRFDRKWMLTDENGLFLTQRDIPALARFSLSIIQEQQLKVSFNNESFSFPAALDAGNAVSVKVWGRAVNAFQPVDPALSSWFSDLLNRKVFPVFFSPLANSSRHRAAAFSDSSPLLVISRGSLDALNAKLANPVSAGSFRPNIVLASDVAFVEDQASEITSGGVCMKFLKYCNRCIMVNVDPVLGVRSPGAEPLKTLSSFRRFEDGKVKFGAYFSPTAGFLREGDACNLISHESRS